MEQTNEQKGLDALIHPSPITIGQLARLERIKSPLLRGDFKNINDCLAALYILSLPASEVLKHIDTLESDTLIYAEQFTHDEYKSRMTALLDSLFAWWDMLPRPDEESKKNDTATDGSLSSQSGVAEPMGTQ